MNLRTLGAWTTTGVAVWASLGVLDVTDGPGGGVRIAMLPAFSALALSVALALLIGLILGYRRTPKARIGTQGPSAPGETRPPGDPFLPLYGLAVLGLPYLPWLPDWIPVMRVFAGPGRDLVWLIVVSQVVWATLGSGRGRRNVARLRAWTPIRSFLIVFSLSALLFGGAAAVLAPSGLFPTGDEPHYLIISQSLLADHDLRIGNNHRQRDYAAYYDAALPPHRIAGGRDGGVYSIHPIALPIVIAPAFAAAGYPGAVIFVILLAAAGAALAWQWVRRITGSVSAATFAWAATALSVPYLTGSGTIYPEVPAALVVILAATVALWDDMLPPSPAAAAAAPMSSWRAVLLGVSAAALPWLHTKYAPMSAALLAIGLWRIWRNRQAARSTRARQTLLCVTPYLVSLAGWFAFFMIIWGSPWPSAAYGGTEGTQMSLASLARGIPGLLVDSEYGVISYAPALAIGLVGLWSMWRHGGRPRALACELTVVLASLAGTVGAFHMWWGGNSLPGRMIVSGLLLLALPIAWEYRRAAERPERRAVYRLLLLMGLAASLAMLAVQNGALLALRRDGVSRLLEWLSPDWHLWAFGPDFIMQPTWAGLLQAGIWIAAVLASAWLAGVVASRDSRQQGHSRTGRGLAFLRANAGALLAVVLATTVMPWALAGRLGPETAPRDRSRVGILESFNPQARPLALRLDPISRVDPRSVPGFFELSARPGSRTARQPSRILLNARLVLPAGHYAVELVDAPTPASSGALAGRLALQVGRAAGGTLAEWDVAADRGGRWTGSFDLPVDAGFVGFRAAPGLRERVGELLVRPLQVVPELERVAAYDVLAASALGPVVVLLHDDRGFPEPGGFWVRGATSTTISAVSPTGRLTSEVRLLLRSPVANSIRIESQGRSWQVDLRPNESQEIRAAAPLEGVLRMRINPRSGFYPATFDPRSRDRRFLGCWIQVVE